MSTATNATGTRPSATRAPAPRTTAGQPQTPLPAAAQTQTPLPAARQPPRTTATTTTADTTNPQRARGAKPTPPADWHSAVLTVANDQCASWVRAEPFRAHVRSVLADTGLHWRALAVAAGVPHRMVHTLLFGRDNRPCRRIRALDAAQLLLFTAGTVERLASTPAPPGSIQSCLRRLARAGHDHVEVAMWLRTPSIHLRRLADGEVQGSALVLAQLVAVCTAAGLEGVRVGQTHNPALGVPSAALPLVAAAAPVEPNMSSQPHMSPLARMARQGDLKDWAA